jgi:hypothetical protein
MFFCDDFMFFCAYYELVAPLGNFGIDRHVRVIDDFTPDRCWYTRVVLIRLYP